MNSFFKLIACNKSAKRGRSESSSRIIQSVSQVITHEEPETPCAVSKTTSSSTSFNSLGVLTKFRTKTRVFKKALVAAFEPKVNPETLPARNEKPRNSVQEAVHDAANSYYFKKLFIDITSLEEEDRRASEALVIERLSEFPSTTQYLINGKWALNYLSYLGGEMIEALSEIDNNFIEKGFIPQDQLVFTVNYYIWRFLLMLYGGGPEIPLVGDNGKKKNLYAFTDERLSLKACLSTPPWLIRDIKEGSRPKSVKLQNEFFMKYGELKTKLTFAVKKSFFKAFKEYLDLVRKEPEKIDNRDIWECIDKGIFHEEYELVNEYMWSLFSQIYNVTGSAGFICIFSERDRGSTPNLQSSDKIGSFESFFNVSLFDVHITSTAAREMALLKCSPETRKLLDVNPSPEMGC